MCCTITSIGVSALLYPSERKNETAKFRPTMPCDALIASSCLSVKLRVQGQSVCTFECVATNGLSDSFSTSQKPCSLRCERSSIIPMRLQARTRLLPRSVKPGPVLGECGNLKGTPCPNMFGRLHTIPSERKPA